jgi:hypothetical protein
MLLRCLRRPLFALLAPLISQLVAARDAVVDPLHFPLKASGDLGEHGLFEGRERVGDVFGHDGVRTIADLAQTFLESAYNVTNWVLTLLHI